jgi:hypothetical protein
MAMSSSLSLHEHASIGEDLFGHERIVLTQQFDHLAGGIALRIGSKPWQVAKEDRQDFSLAPSCKRPGSLEKSPMRRLLSRGNTSPFHNF